MKKITKPSKPPYSDLTHPPTQNISNAATKLLLQTKVDPHKIPKK
jgi:hypothetical protein